MVRGIIVSSCLDLDYSKSLRLHRRVPLTAIVPQCNAKGFALVAHGQGFRQDQVPHSAQTSPNKSFTGSYTCLHYYLAQADRIDAQNTHNTNVAWRCFSLLGWLNRSGQREMEQKVALVTRFCESDRHDSETVT